MAEHTSDHQNWIKELWQKDSFEEILVITNMYGQYSKIEKESGEVLNIHVSEGRSSWSWDL